MVLVSGPGAVFLGSGAVFLESGAVILGSGAVFLGSGAVVPGLWSDFNFFFICSCFYIIYTYT